MRRSNARTRVGSNRNKVDPMLKLQTRSSNPRPNLFARNPKPSPNSFRSNCITFFSLFFIFLLFISYSFFSFSSKSNNNNNSYRNHQQYQIIIDGGSTGSRIHVFKYRGVDSFDFGNDGLVSMRVSPGLSSFAEDPDSAGRSLTELVVFGKGRVPSKSWAVTEIRLMATAGLRMVDVGVQGKILESCRKVLRESGFLFRDDWASVITGSDEGIYAWVVANYALGTLGGDPLNTTGIIELGGASTQVTFVSREPMLYGFSRAVKFGNTTYNLYSHSLLHFGLNVAHDSWREALISGEYNLASQSLQAGLHIDPCTPTGYSHSVESWKFSHGSLSNKRQFKSTVQTRGNFSECRSAALMLLQKGKEKCSYHRCDIGSTFIPKLQGKILATENFFYTSKFFGLEPRAYLSKLMSAGQEFCGDDWLRLKEKYHSHDEEELLQYCFSSAYIVALLHDGLGIALDDERYGYGIEGIVNSIVAMLQHDDPTLSHGGVPITEIEHGLGVEDCKIGRSEKLDHDFDYPGWDHIYVFRVKVANQVGNIPLDWALGAFILQTTAAADAQNHGWITTIFSDESPTLVRLIGILTILLFTAWSISKWRKPQLKTIYDLEKGRYIVTRVVR